MGFKQGCLIIFHGDNSIKSAHVLNADDTVDNATQLWETLVNRGLIGFVYHAQRTIALNNLAADPRWPDTPFTRRQGSAIGLPLSQGSHLMGVMLLIHPEVGFFDDRLITLLEEIGDLVSTALANAEGVEAKVNDTNVRYRIIFDDAVVPILLTDLDGTIIDANRKVGDLLLYNRRDLLHQPVSIIHQSPLEAMGIDSFRDLEPDEEITFRTVALNVSQDEIPVITQVRRLQLDGRDVIEWIEQDITAQMALEQLRRDLTAMVYHDLRGPLQGIMGQHL